MPKTNVLLDLSPVKVLPPLAQFKVQLGLLFILLLGGYMRFYHIDGYGLWSDEFVTLMIVSKDSLLDLIRTCFQVPQPMPPLYFLLDKLIVDCLGPGEISLRLLSAVSSLITVYLIFSIGKTLFNDEVGIFSSLLCAVNSTQVVYAQNARPYAFCLLLSSISILAFLKWLDRAARSNKVGYVLSTSLLFYTHYIFLPLLCIQNLYFLWWRRSVRAKRSSFNSVTWKQWLVLQSYIGLLLIPLLPQIGSIIHSRQSLNWASRLPQAKDFFFFLNANHLFFALAITLIGLGFGIYLRPFFRSSEEGLANWISSLEWMWKPAPAGFRWIQRELLTHSWVFLMLWYCVPLSLFFFLARITGINLFVERYLMISSLPTYLLVSSITLLSVRQQISRAFLIIYVLYYVAAEPGVYFLQKGEFSPGVPGGNEWRETLAELAQPAFSATLFLFQSPFIESNQLNFDSNPELFHYLSAPLHSFYQRDPARTFALLPVHWWIEYDQHRKFKLDIKESLVRHREFVLLSTQEFWDYFEPWLTEELSDQYLIQQIKSFQSTGALRLKKIRLVPLK